MQSKIVFVSHLKYTQNEHSCLRKKNNIMKKQLKIYQHQIKYISLVIILQFFFFLPSNNEFQSKAERDNSAPLEENVEENMKHPATLDLMNFIFKVNNSMHTFPISLSVLASFIARQSVHKTRTNGREKQINHSRVREGKSKTNI